MACLVKRVSGVHSGHNLDKATGVSGLRDRRRTRVVSQPRGNALKRTFQVLITFGAASATALAGATPVMADISPPSGEPETVTGTPFASWQTNGTVRAIETVGNTVWVGGNFTSVRPPGAPPGVREVPRSRIAAFDVNTGALKTPAPQLHGPQFTAPAGQAIDAGCTTLSGQIGECASVWTIKKSPNSDRIFVGGDFQTIDGQDHQRLAALDASTGKLDAAFGSPAVLGRVVNVAVTPSAVYLGGTFSRVAGQSRGNLAAVDAITGAVLPWAPNALKTNKFEGYPVTSLELTDDQSRVVVGGNFDKLNATGIHGLGAVSATTGQTVAWQDQINKLNMVSSMFKSGGLVYTTGLDHTGNHNEGVTAYNADNGAAVWIDGCVGAAHSAAMLRGVVYVGSHAHDCAASVDGFGEQYHQYGAGDARRYTLRAEVPAGGTARLLHWFPTTNDGNGAYAMTADRNNLWVGGEFTKVDNGDQQGLTHFRFLGNGGANHVPETPAAPYAVASGPHRVHVTWKASEDADNRSLEYSLLRDGLATPIARVKSADKPWLKSWMTFIDMAVRRGQVHSYRIRVRDPLGGESALSGAARTRVPARPVPASGLPAAERAEAHYSFDASNGNKFVDAIAGRLATPGSGVSSGAAGAGPTGNAADLSGRAGGAVIDSYDVHSQRQATYEMMFRTTTARGGVLTSIGDSSNPAALSSDNTQVLYMSNNGQLNFGIKPDSARPDPWQSAVEFSPRTLTTPGSYNDGRWHHVAATFEPGTGSRIFVDGNLAAQDASMNWSRSLYGFLRIGGDTVRGWANQPTSANFAGSIDEFAYYGRPLTPAQIANHATTFLTGSSPNELRPQVAQRVKGKVRKKLRRGKIVKLPIRTTTGRAIKWKSATPKICKVRKGMLVAGKKRGACLINARAKGTARILPLRKSYRVKVR